MNITVNKSLHALLAFVFGFALLMSVAVTMPTLAYAKNSGGYAAVSSIVSNKTSDHIFTAYPKETLKGLKAIKGETFKNEGVKFYTPEKSATPVYRLYKGKPASGKVVTHYYTTSKAERDKLIKAGWAWESKSYNGFGEGNGGAFYSSDTKEVPVYQLYNATRGQYHYTANVTERNNLVKTGKWKNQGAKFYALGTTAAQAKDSLPTFTITYQPNGGKGSASKQTFKISTNLKDNMFKRTGYTFANWNTKANGTGATMHAKAKATKSMTLYARWRANGYSVQYVANAPSGTKAAGNMLDTLATYDKASALRANTFTVNGYTFKGWATTANGSVVYKDRATIKNLATSGTVKLYAQWSKNAGTNTTPKPTTVNPEVPKATYSVVFNANGGTGTMKAQTIGVGNSVALSPNAFSRSGYSFTSWNTKADGSGKTYANKSNVKDLAEADQITTLYAQWKKTSAADTTGGTTDKSDKPAEKQPSGISYNPNGGRGMVFGTTGEGIGQPYTTAKNPYVKIGYKFKEWNTKADGSGKSYGQRETFRLEQADMTLYAIWVAL